MGFFEDTIRALNEAGVGNVVDGDLAVVLHGYVRVMPKFDLALRVRLQDVRKADEVLRRVGSKDGIPQTSLVGDEHAEFDELMGQAVTFPLDSTQARVLPIAHLIARKRGQGAALDLVDAEALEEIQRELGGGLLSRRWMAGR